MTMAARNWFRFLRNKFVKPSHKSIILLHNNTARLSGAASTIAEENANINVSSPFQSPKKKELSIQDTAAIKIQATFRGHLARRAYSALRSLVKLQALVRGVRVRKQTHIALNCMHALVRLQVRVHARQLLSKCSNDDS